MDGRETLTAIYRTTSEREITFLAASVAYYAFVSLVPLVVLALAVGSLIGGATLAERLIDAAGDLLPAAGEELLTAALTAESGRTEASIVAVVVATWGGIKVFRGLSKAFDRVYGADEKTALVTELLEGVVVTLGVVGAFGLMIGVGVLLRALPGTVPFAGPVGWLLLVGGLVAAFLPIYYVLPPTAVTVREALPGTTVAAVGWTVLQAGFQLYASIAAGQEAYGALGAVLLFVTWLYFAGVLMLLGAVVNVVVAGEDI